MIDKAALPPRGEARVYEGEKEVMGRSGSDGGVFGSGVLCVMRCVLGVRLCCRGEIGDVCVVSRARFVRASVGRE